MATKIYLTPVSAENPTTQRKLLVAYPLQLKYCRHQNRVLQRFRVCCGNYRCSLLQGLRLQLQVMRQANILR